VGHEIILNNDQVTCAPLLNFLCLTCTRNVDADTASPLARPEFTVPLADPMLTRHRIELVEHKVPGLNRTPLLAADQQISQSLGELIQQQRAARTDAATCQALSALKTIEEYFGASVHTLLRLWQVATTAALPPMYQQMADHGRRKEWTTMQRAINDMMNQMGLHDLQFVITGELAAKITSLMWKAHPEDLSQGVHPFSIGETSPDTIMALQEHARIFDLISGGAAAPNLEDAQSLAGLGKAVLPNSLIALNAQNHLFLCFLNVFLGIAHIQQHSLGPSHEPPILRTENSPSPGAPPSAHPMMEPATLELLGRPAVE
jgi:hypothetical protein